jgi:hypothetical protein
MDIHLKIDLTKVTVQELKNLLANNQKPDQLATVRAVLDEMARRGVARRPDYRALKWNQDSVHQVMQPFKDVAETVSGNRRKTYTEAGGRRIGLSKNDPEWFWIDTYSAIKTPAINAVFVCYIKRPGDEPEFRLRINSIDTQTYNADQLTEALIEWRAIAARAVEIIGNS